MTDEHTVELPLFESQTMDDWINNDDEDKIPDLSPSEPNDNRILFYKSIEIQRTNHNIAKEWILKHGNSDGMSVEMYSPPQIHINIKSPINMNMKENKELYKNCPLDPQVFLYYISNDIEIDIVQDSYIDSINIYGIVSKYNACNSEEEHLEDPCPEILQYLYEQSPIQGATVHMMFPEQQRVCMCETAKRGFNSMCNVLDNKTSMCINNGMLVLNSMFDISSINFSKIISKIEKTIDKMEFMAITNTPNNGRSPIILLMCSSPLFNRLAAEQMTADDKYKLSYICALNTYRAQLLYVVNYSKNTNNKQIIFKPCVLGLGFFNNDISAITHAFYKACKGFERTLQKKSIKVCLQIESGYIFTCQSIIDNLFEKNDIK